MISQLRLLPQLHVNAACPDGQNLQSAVYAAVAMKKVWQAAGLSARATFTVQDLMAGRYPNWDIGLV